MNIKRMEVMLEDLSENFDRHIATTFENCYFVLKAVDGESNLKIRLYSQGSEAELEVLAFPLGDNQPSCQISVDGEAIDGREGVITIAPISLARGWRVVEISGHNMTAGRVRIKGSIAQASIQEN